MTYGYVYCFSNPCMPGILKIGMTERTPVVRLREANMSNTWIPAPFIIELAIKVKNPKQKETAIHLLLDQYVERTHSRREFFKVSVEEIKCFFDLMDGEYWQDDDPKTDDEYTIGCRVMSKCFTDGQEIRHKIGITKFLYGTYNAEKDAIIYNDKCYSLHKFAGLHYNIERPARTKWNAWSDCEYLVDGKWISTYSLPSCI